MSDSSSSFCKILLCWNKVDSLSIAGGLDYSAVAPDCIPVDTFGFLPVGTFAGLLGRIPVDLFVD